MGVAPWPLASCPANLDVVQLDGAALPASETRYRGEQSGFSVTVKADDSEPFSGVDYQV